MQQGLSLKLDLIDSARWAEQKDPVPPVSASFLALRPQMHTTSDFSKEGVKGLNSGLHFWAVNTLRTESSPRTAPGFQYKHVADLGLQSKVFPMSITKSYCRFV